MNSSFTHELLIYFHIFGDFSYFFQYWFFLYWFLIPLWLQNTLNNFNHCIFINTFYVCGPVCGLSWQMFQMHFQCVLGIVFCSCQLAQVGWLPYSSILYPVSSLLILLTVQRKVLKSPTLIVKLPIFPFKSVSFCLMYFVPLLRIFRIFLFSCYIHTFIVLKCLFLSPVLLCVIKYILADII